MKIRVKTKDSNVEIYLKMMAQAGHLRGTKNEDSASFLDYWNASCVDLVLCLQMYQTKTMWNKKRFKQQNVQQQKLKILHNYQNLQTNVCVKLIRMHIYN